MRNNAYIRNSNKWCIVSQPAMDDVLLRIVAGVQIRISQWLSHAQPNATQKLVLLDHYIVGKASNAPTRVDVDCLRATLVNCLLSPSRIVFCASKSPTLQLHYSNNNNNCSRFNSATNLSSGFLEMLNAWCGKKVDKRHAIWITRDASVRIHSQKFHGNYGMKEAEANNNTKSVRQKNGSE